MQKTTLNKIIEESREIFANRADNPSLVDVSDLTSIAEEFEYFDLNWDNKERLKYVYSRVWICTDTWVGMKIYFLDNEPVFVSVQTARKSSETFTFLSEDSISKVKNYLETLRNSENTIEHQVYSEETFDEEISSLYQVNYPSNILHKYGLYQLEIDVMEPCEIVSKPSGYVKTDKFPDVFENVEIKILRTNETFVTTIDLLNFKYNQKLDEIPTLD